MGRLVIATFTLNVTTIARNTVVGTGLPMPTTNAHVPVAAGGNRAGIMYVDATNGRLILEEALPSAGWYVGTVPYIASS